MAMVVTVPIHLLDHNTWGMAIIEVPDIIRIRVFTEVPDPITWVMPIIEAPGIIRIQVFTEAPDRIEDRRLPDMDREVAEGLDFMVLVQEAFEVVGGAMAAMADRRIITE